MNTECRFGKKKVTGLCFCLMYKTKNAYYCLVHKTKVIL